jgi:hypothetical protein
MRVSNEWLDVPHPSPNPMAAVAQLRAADSPDLDCPRERRSPPDVAVPDQPHRRSVAAAGPAPLRMSAPNWTPIPV